MAGCMTKKKAGIYGCRYGKKNGHISVAADTVIKDGG